MIIMAIDGACRRPGKPNCLSAGSVFTKTTVGNQEAFSLTFINERQSTSQRGELNALVTGLDTVGMLMDMLRLNCSIYLITDSEYIFNTVSKDWIGNWRRKNWVTWTDEPVKNRDILEAAGIQLDRYRTNNFELVPYHIKGHLLPFGKAEATKLLLQDKTGKLLYKVVRQKLHNYSFKPDELSNALNLFERNHGYLPPMDILMEMIACNTVADLAAGYHADIADAEWIKM